MASTKLSFSSSAEHRAWLATQASLPQGFRVGTTRFSFIPAEISKPAQMNLTLIALDRPTPDFAAVFTRNALPGAPVIVGRQRLDEPTLGAIVINNKISNVCAPLGVENAERICATTAATLGLSGKQILPCSTGIIGWRLPVDDIVVHVPKAAAALTADSVLPAALGIMTTDLYPKIRAATVGTGRIVGIAKGAGMVEPHLATMLVYILTDLAIPRAELRAMLRRVVEPSFNSITVDSDTSTSDTVVLASSGIVPCTDVAAFEQALAHVCADLAEDVVRNGEGVRHVVQLSVTGAPDQKFARDLGRAVLNSPLVKTAISGNDPNVGRIVAAIGKHVGLQAQALDLSRLHISMGGKPLLADREFCLSAALEAQLIAHLKDAELYTSVGHAAGVFKPPVDFPPHERSVEIEIALNAGTQKATILGADLTHEYVSENADYRS